MGVPKMVITPKSWEGDTLGVRFFTAFCNHWHCTCAMVLSLLCNHWQFLFGFSTMAKQNQKQKRTKKQDTKKPRNQKTKRQKKTKKTKWQDPTLYHYYPPWGVQSCFFVFFFFFVFFGFLVSWFFGFLFFGSFLVSSAMAKQNQKTKKKTQLSATITPLGVCNLVFFLFFKTTVKKTMAKCKYHWRKLGGLGTQIRQFYLFM